MSIGFIPKVVSTLGPMLKRRITEEFRSQLSIEAPHVRRGEPKPGDELMRIIN